MLAKGGEKVRRAWREAVQSHKAELVARRSVATAARGGSKPRRRVEWSRVFAGIATITGRPGSKRV